MSEHTKTTKELARNLPIYYENSEESGHYKLLESVAKRLNKQQADIKSVEAAALPSGDIEPSLRVPAGEEYVVESGTTEHFTNVTVEGTLTINGEIFTFGVQNNGTINNFNNITVDEDWAIDRMEPLGKLVDVTPREGESFAHYKARVLAEYAIATCEGTIEDVLDTSAYILDIETNELRYEEPAAGWENGTVEMAFPAQALDDAVLSDQDVAEAVERLLAASYSLQSIRLGTFTYRSLAQESAGDNDPSKAYDGLDSNGDPKDNGGTYAGLISRNA